MAFTEITVSPGAPMPHGYKLLRKGYPFMTALCRRKTLAAGQTLYVVRAGSKTLGLRAPKDIVNEVHSEEHQTRATRRAAVAARDESTRSTFDTALRKRFSEMPAVDREQVLQRALKKRSGRVGRTSKLTMEDKVRLAVAAHVRHMHTDYDRLVRGETSREDARRAVYASVRGVLASWESRADKKEQANEKKQVTKEGQKAKDENAKKRKTVAREEGPRRPTPNTRATRKARLGQLDGNGKVFEPTSTSLDDPILISSDSEEDGVDVLVISSDEE
ncbi:hypothetical protein LLEC1_04293 [Akanthomyces lecanii]|uniref:DUF2293 domain-containing protein n=1 Tax=Cordyceps confragosa TaxID=2714763 RepID=A0A179I9L3_CORDF|nr:hypothetical protein LLEC1_04293 [Akanthomyces lecanii]